MSCSEFDKAIDQCKENKKCKDFKTLKEDARLFRDDSRIIEEEIVSLEQTVLLLETALEEL